MTRLLSLVQLRAPLGGQEIELQQLDHEGGGMSLLRTRIREHKRFTVFDIDPITAASWGQALLDWAAAQPANGAPPATVTASDTAHTDNADNAVPAEAAGSAEVPPVAARAEGQH